jgi:integrase
MNLQTLIDAYRASYQGRDPSLRARLDFWRNHLGHVDLQAIDADVIDDAMAALATRGALKFVRGQGVVSANRPLTPATLNRHLVALGSVLSYARRRRLLPRNAPNPVSGVDKLTESEGRLLYLTAEEVEKVIACAAMAHWKKLPALIRLAFTTGLRLGALQGLRWRDVDLAAGRAFVERRKNGRPHVAHLTPSAVTALRALPGHRLPEGLVFSGRDEYRPHTFRKAWTVACSAAGVEHVPFHALRHSCASHLAARGASSVLLADTLGHRSLRMVARYAHLSIDARASAIQAAFEPNPEGSQAGV